MKKIVDIAKETAHYYHWLFTLIPRALHIILHSGRACTKSTFLCIGTLGRLLVLPKSDVVVLGYEFTSMKKKVFTDFKVAAEILGLSKDMIKFRSNNVNEMYILVKNGEDGNKIFFEHIKTGPEKLKGMRPEVGHRGIEVRFYELTNFYKGDGEMIANVVSTFIRNANFDYKGDKIEEWCKENHREFQHDGEGLISQEWFKDNGEDFITGYFCCTYEFNTPSKSAESGAGVTDGYRKQKNSKHTIYQFNTYLDMTFPEQMKFLKPQTLSDINHLRDNDPMTYNHVYLGREPYDGDLVFPTISKDKHFGQHKDFDPDVITVGVDVGLGDATVFCMNGFQMNRSDLKVGLGIHNGGGKPNANNGFGADIRDGKQFKFFPLTLYDLYNRLMDFLNMVHNEYPHLPIFLQIDYAGYGQALYDELLVRHPKPSGVITSRCGMKEPLVDRIKLIQDLLTLPDALKIYDINTFNAYANQIGDTKIYKDGARRLDDPTNEGLDMDRQDACEYGIPHQLYLLIKKRLSINRGKGKN